MALKRLQPVVGISTSFTGKYKASKLILRFLELIDVNLIKSTKTKPAIIEAGSTIVSADYCLPLRVYVGHIYHLIQEHPNIEYIVAPIIKGEYPSSNTCAKYRDLDGVLIRSLGTITGYRLKQSGLSEMDRLKELIGEDKTKQMIDLMKDFPTILAPEIESIDKRHLKQVCVKLYADLFGLNKVDKMRLILNDNLVESDNEDIRKIGEAFEQAYREVIGKESERYQNLLSDESKPRLALVGRNYLIEDPALSADIKSYFKKKGVIVLTSQDIPFSVLRERYDNVQGFYDSHKISQAFIDTVIDQVDGFVVIGSFGCHPDAFQVDYFANYITEQGKSCWTFKFDEQTGGVGFHTRYETILGFLQQNRDKRLKNLNYNNQPAKVPSIDWNFGRKSEPVKPIFIWPHMGTGIDLIIKEIWHQIGLGDYLYPPRGVNEETITRGNTHYTESCSPFALYLGSLRETLDRLLMEIEEPRRIIILMAKGKGPCTFGWYSLAGFPLLQKEYQDRLKKHGHSLEMIAIDNQGRNLVSFLEELSKIADNDRLSQIIGLLNKIQTEERLNIINKTKLEIKLIRVLKDIVWSGWKKLLAYEDIQNKALIVRAHELKRGDTTRLLKKWVDQLEVVHTLPEISKVTQLALQDFEQIPQDGEVKPKVVVVGEIYGTLTPFANRGTVDNLLGQAGIEAIQGMRLSHFIRGAFKGVKNSFVREQPIIKKLIKLLESKGLYYHNRWVREPGAKPFIEHEIGGDGQPTIAHARHHIEHDGVDGIVHIYPFKCMPEGMAKDALIEMSQLYGIKSLHLSYDKETEIERLKTEIGTFAALLHQDIEHRKGITDWKKKELIRRYNIGKMIEQAYRRSNNKFLWSNLK
ncbi:hypothetical protein BHF71_06155 [Vulcanibacillus modesticaldus]|uniref:DUF2229 domain-containing protein n=2 Tax=Vulcanibacillus modesticaldus TaxID=337097 RepID=A0A1D2YWI1_9BACI|nr:hypothetical protein BHF71_06155 [Vulcanibacillus modesticaldus]